MYFFVICLLCPNCSTGALPLILVLVGFVRFSSVSWIIGSSDLLGLVQFLG